MGHHEGHSITSTWQRELGGANRHYINQGIQLARFGRLAMRHAHARPCDRTNVSSQNQSYLSSWFASFSSLPRPVSFGQTFPLSLCHHFVVPSLHACLGAVPTVGQSAVRWGRRHACNLAELSLCNLNVYEYFQHSEQVLRCWAPGWRQRLAFASCEYVRVKHLLQGVEGGNS